MDKEIPARILKELGGDKFTWIWEVEYITGEQRDDCFGVSDGFEYHARVGMVFYKDKVGGRDYLNILVGQDGNYRLEFSTHGTKHKEDAIVMADNLCDVSDLISKYIFDSVEAGGIC
jgi:hypothetical protein